jgi:hypothetical protein
MQPSNAQEQNASFQRKGETRMKIDHTTRYPAALKLAIGVLIATCVFTTAATAQPSFAGRFTLPYEVRWGQAVLPAGDYVIRMDSTASPAKISRADGSNAGIFTGPPLVEDSRASGMYLTVTNQANRRTVRSLNLPQLGKVIVFAPLTKSEREAYAKAGQINTVPVVTAKK